MANNNNNNTLVEKADSVVAGWQSTTETQTHRNGTLPPIVRMQGATVLIVNLAHIPVASVVADIGKMSDEEAKKHEGVWATFAIVKIMDAGYASVGGDYDSGSGGGGKRKKGGFPQKGDKSGAGEKSAGNAEEKLCEMSGQDLLMYTFSMVNRKGIYHRDARSISHSMISPGYIFRLKVWGSKCGSVFKDQPADLPPFSLAFAQLGFKSEGSTAMKTGYMMELKSMVALPEAAFTMSSHRLVPYDIFPHSIQQAQTMKEAFLGQENGNNNNGGSSSNNVKEGRSQDLIKNCLPSLNNFVSVSPNNQHGVFAIGPDGLIKFHFSKPIADVNANAVNVRYDHREFGVRSKGDEEWVAKMLNVACMLGATQLFVNIDGYKMRNATPEDTILDGFVRIDVHAMVGRTMGVKPVTVVDSGDAGAFVMDSVPQPVAKLGVLYMGCVKDLDIMIDTRRLTKKLPNPNEEISSSAIFMANTVVEPSSSIAHPNYSKWDRGNLVHVFFQKQPVMSFLIPIIEGSGNAAELSKKALQPASLMHSLCDCECEEDSNTDNNDNEAGSSAASASTASASASAASADVAAVPGVSNRKKAKTSAT